MSDYVTKLRLEKKTELSQRVSLSLVDDIWEMSLTLDTEEEFVDYLMTITDHEAVEEFFNKCHGQGGRFCGGGGGGGGPVSGKAKPGYKGRGIKIGWKENAQLKKDRKAHRAASADFRAAVGPLGHLRSKKFAKMDLKKFSTDELKTIDSTAGVIQRNTDFARRWSISPVQRIIMRGLSERAGAQRTRVRAEIKKRGSKSQFPFAVESEELDGQVFEFADSTPEQKSELIAFFNEYVNDTDPDSELSPEEKTALKALIETIKSEK
jgi:hypothetical protein